MTNEELEKEIALWKRATGYDNPEDLDSFLGRAGVLNQFDVLNKMLADANKEKEQLRALLIKARTVLDKVSKDTSSLEIAGEAAWVRIHIDAALEKQNV
jgi:hypothetical protein